MPLSDFEASSAIRRRTSFTGGHAEQPESLADALAGQTPPDYRLLNARYGMRFVPQDMDHLQPEAAGLLGPVQLVIY